MPDLLIAILTTASGAAAGFVWGCKIGLVRPAFARGFIAGFSAPLAWMVKPPVE